MRLPRSLTWCGAFLWLAGAPVLGHADEPARRPSAPTEPPSAPPPYFPVNAALLMPLATNAAHPNLRTNFDLALIAGRTGAVDGFALGPMGWVGYTLRGAQIGAAGIVGRRVQGAQIEGVFAYADGPVTGVQLTGLMTWATENLAGAQLAGVASQLSGDLRGVQLSGVASIARKEVVGAQLAGAVSAGRVEGFQLAAINVSQRVRGLQIGIVNVARRIDGLQIGVVNVTDDLQGESLGIAPIPRRGGVHPVLWGSNSVFGNVGVKLSSRWAYSIVSGALHSASKRGASAEREIALGGALTMGARFEIADSLGVAGDLGAYRFFRDGVSFAGHDELYKLRLIGSFALARRMTPFLGVGVYLSAREEENGRVQLSLGPELCAGVEL